MNISNNPLSRRQFSGRIVSALTVAGVFIPAGRVLAEEKVQGILPLTLRSRGLDPSEVKVAAGTYAVTVFNHSGLQSEFTVELNQIQNGTPVTVLNQKMQRGATQWFRSARLVAGTYQLKISGYTYSGWPSTGLICTITVS